MGRWEDGRMGGWSRSQWECEIGIGGRVEYRDSWEGGIGIGGRGGADGRVK